MWERKRGKDEVTELESINQNMYASTHCPVCCVPKNTRKTDEAREKKEHTDDERRKKNQYQRCSKFNMWSKCVIAYAPWSALHIHIPRTNTHTLANIVGVTQSTRRFLANMYLWHNLLFSLFTSFVSLSIPFVVVSFVSFLISISYTFIYYTIHK